MVQPGRVTGFLGPNDAGRSTTMWLILGSAAAVYLLIRGRRSSIAAMRMRPSRSHCRVVLSFEPPSATSGVWRRSKYERHSWYGSAGWAGVPFRQVQVKRLYATKRGERLTIVRLGEVAT